MCKICNKWYQSKIHLVICWRLLIKGKIWRCGRVVYCASLENWRSERARRFESYRLRAKNLSDGQHIEINCPENNYYISMVVIEKLWVLF